MKLPEQVKVGPYTYPVSVVEDLRDPDDRKQQLYGYYRTSPPAIQVRADEHAPRMLASFLHEAIHVIDEYMLIGLSEKQTTRLATGLAAFLADNRLLKED